jgi:hypothetical protein
MRQEGVARETKINFYIIHRFLRFSSIKSNSEQKIPNFGLKFSQNPHIWNPNKILKTNLLIVLIGHRLFHRPFYLI